MNSSVNLYSRLRVAIYIKVLNCKTLLLSQHILFQMPNFLGTDTISVSDFTGLAPAVLISGGLEEPRAIALHPGAG